MKLWSASEQDCAARTQRLKRAATEPRRFVVRETIRSAVGRAALRLTEVARCHEAQLGTEKRYELGPHALGCGHGENIERGPEALREEHDGAVVRLVVVAVVVDVFVGFG
jgi:hypothetical protein